MKLSSVFDANAVIRVKKAVSELKLFLTRSGAKERM